MRGDLRSAVLARIPVAWRKNLSTYPIVKKNSEEGCILRIGKYEFQCQSILNAAQLAKKSVEEIANGDAPAFKIEYVLLLIATPLVLLAILVSVSIVIRKRRVAAAAAAQLNAEMAMCNHDDASTSSIV